MSTTKLLELRPKRDLLDPNFNGYKLSLEKLPILEKEFQVPIERILPNSDQYSLLHAKLFGLQNFLFADHFNENSNTYFIDKDSCVQKIVINEDSRLISGIEKVFEIPKSEESVSDKLNPGLFFASETIVLISDGQGMLYIVSTGNRSENQNWKIDFGEKILQNEEPFTLIDAVCLKNETCNEIHCLLTKIEKNGTDEKFYTLINWVMLTQTSDLKWGPVQFKVLKGGQFYYCALERNCKSIYVASDSSFKFILDSENPIVEEKPTLELPKKYKWSQNSTEIDLKINIPSSNKELVAVTCTPRTIEVKFDTETLLSGELANRIDSDLTIWTIKENILEIVLNKAEEGQGWSEFIKNDTSGEQIFDPEYVEEVHRKLSQLCTENEEISTETGPSFSSQQIEECDFANEELAIFERISSETHKVSHTINLGSIQYITTVILTAGESPAIVLRHDVDGCIWQPKFDSNSNEFKMEHLGTLLAFGYVQASKQQRKFLTCSPQFSYSTICESSCHIFIYRQNKLVNSGELRNRRSGRRVNSVAEQQLINIGDQEIFGIHATEEFLYLLLEKKILIIKIC